MKPAEKQSFAKYLKNNFKKRLYNSIKGLLLHPQQRISSLGFEIYKWFLKM